MINAGSSRNFNSLKKVADRLEVSLSSVRRWVKAGELPVYRLGGQLRVSDPDLELFLKIRRTGGRY